MTTNETKTAAHNGLQQAAGIIWTATTILNRTNQSKEALPVSVAGALGEMLTNARERLLDTREESKMGDLSAVEHILKVARQEKVQVSPTISGALTDILVDFTEGMLKDPAVLSGGHRCDHKCGHGCGGLCTHDNPEAQHVVTLPLNDPELNRLGVDEIELWSVPAAGGGNTPESKDKLKEKLLNVLRRVRETKERVNAELDRRKAQSAFKKDVEDAGKERDAMAAEKGLRVPDWRDTQGVPGSGSLRNATGTAEDDPDTARGEQISLFPDEDKPSKPAKPEVKPAKEKVKPDGTVEVSGFFSPEEAETMIGNIREWLSNCRDGHRLADILETIKQLFELTDQQIGELLGVSDRLICHVRHGRPSPFVLTRFTEVFGHAGGVKED